MSVFFQSEYKILSFSIAIYLLQLLCWCFPGVFGDKICMRPITQVRHSMSFHNIWRIWSMYEWENKRLCMTVTVFHDFAMLAQWMICARKTYTDATYMYRCRFISSFGNNTITIDVNGTDTMCDVKYSVEQKLGIPSDSQKFRFGGRQLIDNCSLTDQKIYQESTLQLLLHWSMGL